MAKMVYFFGDGKAEGTAEMRNLLGGKGSNLAEMSNLGIPVPAGFTITTEVCTHYYQNKHNYPEGLKGEVEAAMAQMEKVMGARFGDTENPLLVSVRSGARVSMPGMMDTVLNLGLNDTTIKGFIEQIKSERTGYDSYRRFIQMYGNVVLGVPSDKFEELIEETKKEKDITNDVDITADDWKKLVAQFKKIVEAETGKPFPEQPWEQLWGAVGAVFGSWETQRAISYRKINRIPDHWGTAVNVQAMVFGNTGDDSATGVAFTRDPATGENRFYGEFLPNAQGEDVVAGIRTPQPINERPDDKSGLPTLEATMPVAYKELEGIYKNLEVHYRDMQDIEFTIQNKKLWMLQTRRGKRTAAASVKIAVDMANEGLISREEAVLQVDPDQLDQLLHPALDPDADKDFLADGLPASPGAASGEVVFTADEAEAQAAEGKAVILVRLETSPEDIHGMNAAQGILTARGGMTSHAAVVARGMGKSCVAGCGDISVDYKNKSFSVGDKVIKEGDWITLDGSDGIVYLGQVPTVEPTLAGEFATLMAWADDFRKLGVRTNADTPHDAEVAREFGAEGIGLCRTEHMFFEADRIAAVREMILARDVVGREKALAKIEPMQREDFLGIFRAMDGLPVTIRTLDPPLHEFLPHERKEIEGLAATMGVEADKLENIVQSLSEANPMLGHRGCRLGIIYPEITATQARAIIDAAIQAKKEGVTVLPEIMIPLVADVEELKRQKEVVVKAAEEVMEKAGVKVDYMVGTMIELPRAALTADKVAEEAEFFSFGTNDLTQTTFGLSRDDAGKFLPAYVDSKILPDDPFQSIDVEGVGQLVQIGVDRGRQTRPDLKIGICGEHGGDPRSVEFCHKAGLNYVSCSPYRVPVARLAAAHAALKEKRGESFKDV